MHLEAEGIFELTCQAHCRFLRKWKWMLIWFLNISIILVWLFGQFAFGVYFSSQKLHNNIRSVCSAPLLPLIT